MKLRLFLGSLVFAALCLILPNVWGQEIGSRPIAGGQATYQITDIVGPATVAIPIGAIPEGATEVQVRLELAVRDNILIDHLDYPPSAGSGFVVWSTYGEVGALTAEFEIEGLPAMVAEVDSSVGASWPLSDSGAFFSVPTVGAPSVLNAAPWSKPTTALVRFGMAITSVSAGPMSPASVSMLATQDLTATVTWR